MLEIIRVKLGRTMLWEIKFNALNIVVFLMQGTVGQTELYPDRIPMVR